MHKTLAVLGTSIALLAAASGASADDDGPTSVVQGDLTNDVRTHSPTQVEESAPAFIKQSIDLDHVRYTVRPNASTPQLRIAYQARNVLRADHRRGQQFRTRFTGEWRHSSALIGSNRKGPLRVWRFDHGSAVRVKCPDARVKLRPGPGKERVVQVVPLRCLKVLGEKNAYLRSKASVLPLKPHRFVSSDHTPETGAITLR